METKMEQKHKLIEIFTDGHLLSWLRIMCTPIIIVSLFCLVWAILNKYDVGAYVCMGLISLSLTGKVVQSKIENGSNTRKIEDNNNTNVMDN